MVEGKKYTIIALEVHEMLLMKAETAVSPIASTIKQTRENLKIVWNLVVILEKKSFDCTQKS